MAIEKYMMSKFLFENGEVDLENNLDADQDQNRLEISKAFMDDQLEKNQHLLRDFGDAPSDISEKIKDALLSFLSWSNSSLGKIGDSGENAAVLWLQEEFGTSASFNTNDFSMNFPFADNVVERKAWTRAINRQYLEVESERDQINSILANTTQDVQSLASQAASTNEPEIQGAAEDFLDALNDDSILDSSQSGGASQGMPMEAKMKSCHRFPLTELLIESNTGAPQGITWQTFKNVCINTAEFLRDKATDAHKDVFKTPHAWVWISTKSSGQKKLSSEKDADGNSLGNIENIPGYRGSKVHSGGIDGFGIIRLINEIRLILNVIDTINIREHFESRFGTNDGNLPNYEEEENPDVFETEDTAYQKAWNEYKELLAKGASINGWANAGRGSNNPSREDYLRQMLSRTGTDAISDIWANSYRLTPEQQQSGGPTELSQHNLPPGLGLQQRPSLRSPRTMESFKEWYLQQRPAKNEPINTEAEYLRSTGKGLLGEIENINLGVLGISLKWTTGNRSHFLPESESLVGFRMSFGWGQFHKSANSKLDASDIGSDTKLNTFLNQATTTDGLKVTDLSIEELGIQADRLLKALERRNISKEISNEAGDYDDIQLTGIRAMMGKQPTENQALLRKLAQALLMDNSSNDPINDTFNEILALLVRAKDRGEVGALKDDNAVRNLRNTLNQQFSQKPRKPSLAPPYRNRKGKNRRR